MRKASWKSIIFSPWALLIFLYFVCLYAIWPGILSPDASLQYKQAIAGVYSDHHPPAMSVLWRYLNYIYPGSGLLFGLHISLLFSSAAILIYLFSKSPIKWWYSIYPIMPNVLAYTALLVKDASFVFTYLLASVTLAYLMLKEIKPKKFFYLSVIYVILLYGSAVKFQAKYLLIFYTLALSYCACNYRWHYKSIITGIILYIVSYFAIIGFNAYMVPNVQADHTWQFVKFYDLAAMSVKIDQPLFPDFVQQQPNFSFSKIKDQFSHSEVDSLVFGSNPTLQGGATDAQRATLLNYWRQQVIQHPWLYLQARLKLWSYNLFSAPSEAATPINYIQTTKFANLLNYSWLNYLIDKGYLIYKKALYFVWLLPLLVIYTIFAIRNCIRVPAARPLLLICSASAALLFVLFFCSMAGRARYVLLCTCLINAAHGFALQTWISLRNKRNESNQGLSSDSILLKVNH